MKKLGILLLLTTVLAAFSFAQVSVTGGFELANVSGAKIYDEDAKELWNDKMDPARWTEFYGTGSRELGPGSIGAALGLGTKLHFGEDVKPYGTAGDIYLKGFYNLPAGPGTLAIGVSTWSMFDSLQFGLDYDGIAAGPVSLGLGLAYTLNTTGETGTGDDKKAAVFGDEDKEWDVFTAKLSADFDFGLGIIYKFQYGIGDSVAGKKVESDIKKIVYLDVSFQVMDPLKVGIELDDTGKDFKGDLVPESETLNLGFTLKPYVEYAISENTTAGFAFVINGINGGKKDSFEVVPFFTPQLTISHSF
jgi:hypothetical protein